MRVSWYGFWYTISTILHEKDNNSAWVET